MYWMWLISASASAGVPSYSSGRSSQSMAVAGRCDGQASGREVVARTGRLAGGWAEVGRRDVVPAPVGSAGRAAPLVAVFPGDSVED